MTEVTETDCLGRSAAKPSRKLHKRFTPWVFAFYMALIMAFFMCCIIVAVNGGLSAGYWWTVLKAMPWPCLRPFAVWCWCALW